MTQHNGSQMAYQAPGAPKKRPSRLGRSLAIAGVVTVGAVVAIVLTAPDQPASTAAAGPAATVTVTATVTGPAATTVTAPPLPAATVTYTPPAPPKPAAWGPGTYLVGTDMEPGAYRSAGTERGCYWARLRNDAGDIIANNLVNGPGPTRFTAKKGEFVEISMCEFVKA